MTTNEKMAAIARIVKDIEFLQEQIAQGLYSWYFETAIQNLSTIKDLIYRDGTSSS